MKLNEGKIRFPSFRRRESILFINSYEFNKFQKKKINEENKLNNSNWKEKLYFIYSLKLSNLSHF